MFEIAKRTGLAALILMIIPFLVWVSGWQWHPDGRDWWWRGLYWITQTVTSPLGVVTSGVLFGWFLWCLRFRLKPALVLACILIATLVVGQAIKSLIKNRVQEARPYVLWLEKTYNLDEKAFYALPSRGRAEMVRKELQDGQQIPTWLRKHWQHETGYAFPSGHTVFAVTWALLAVGLLWPRRHRLTVAVIMLWSAAVICSRMVLGMHWPRDIMAGIALSWLIIVLACWLVQRFIGPLTPKSDESDDIHSRD